MRTTEKPYFLFSLTPIILGIMSMTACSSYFDAPDPQSPQIDLMGDETAVVDNTANNTPAAEPLTFDEIAGAVSNSNVKVFGMEQVEPSTLQAPAGYSAPRPINVTPNVQVFPLDGGAAPVVPTYSSSSPFKPSAAPVMKVVESNPAVSPIAGDTATRIYFGHGSATLSAQDEIVLNNVSQSLGNRPVRVVGYSSTDAEVSDPVVRKQVNLRESLNRAYAAAKALIAQGVPAANIETVGMGENSGSANASDARRVEIQPK